MPHRQQWGQPGFTAGPQSLLSGARQLLSPSGASGPADDSHLSRPPGSELCLNGDNEPLKVADLAGLTFESVIPSQPTTVGCRSARATLFV